MADASDRIREHRERQERLEYFAEQARADLAQRRKVLDNVNTIAAYAKDMKDFLNESELTERRAFIQSFVKEIIVVPGDALLRYTVPMPDNSLIPGRSAEKVALNGSVLPTLPDGGPLDSSLTSLDSCPKDWVFLPCNVRPLFGEFGLDFDRSAPPVVSNREHIRRAIPSLASPTAKVAPQLGHVLSTEALLVVFEPIPQLRRARLRGKSTTPPSGRLCQGRRHRGPPGRWNGVPPVRIEATTLEAGEGLPVGRIERGRRAKRRQVGPGAGRRCSPGCPSAVALAVRLQDVDVVGEPVQQRAGQALRAEDLDERFRSGGGQGHEAQFVDDQQVQAGQYFTPVLSGHRPL